MRGSSDGSDTEGSFAIRCCPPPNASHGGPYPASVSPVPVPRLSARSLAIIFSLLRRLRAPSTKETILARETQTYLVLTTRKYQSIFPTQYRTDCWTLSERRFFPPRAHMPRDSGLRADGFGSDGGSSWSGGRGPSPVGSYGGSSSSGGGGGGIPQRRRARRPVSAGSSFGSFRAPSGVSRPPVCLWRRRSRTLRVLQSNPVARGSKTARKGEFLSHLWGCQAVGRRLFFFPFLLRVHWV